jgi:hypothetical protein
MQGELAMTQSMPQLPPERERHTLVMPLDYERPPVPPEAPPPTGLMLLASGIRRLCLGAGVAMLVGGMIVGANPRADETAAFIGMGLGLITCAAPLPKWWR